MNLAALVDHEVASAAPAESAGSMLRLLTCGSVDDGKSTLIGRLLWESGAVPDDQREAVLAASKGRSNLNGEEIDFSLLLDGLQAEREQGITIDIAWRFFESASRRYVIIDAPGHEQYTRNMATGASHADVAILLIDARHGAKRQTRRHAAICDLVGIRNVVLAVNKMDLIDFDEATFRRIEAEFYEMTKSFGFEQVQAIPVAALTGDNVSGQSARMPWYDGPSLLEYLEESEPAMEALDAPFRFPVQTVLRNGDFRGYAGTVASGAIRPGDRILDARSGLSAHVRRIATMDGDREEAAKGDAVAIELDAELDISRGAVLSEADHAPVNGDVVEARIVWVSETPFDPEAGYLLLTNTDQVPVSSISISALIDFESLQSAPAHDCKVNDIADCRILLGRPAAFDLFSELPATGNFVLVSAIDGATVAGGVITFAQSGAATPENTFVLSRDLLARGLCSDLGDSAEDRAEFERRAQEAANLLRSVGVPVIIEI
ncbi:Sulfate adenylyltransferase subunit 1 [Methyloligella halotolerans]|uniref:Bifunctional enzyme NodQ n=1 Tax=Methyloligella halotolerans TaxID=1177755 RepID=A0A1E2RXY0_9HYPH|nr:GTP-binding protein [Methyloligella halotolerans]ODA67083.1 Sulfate adenylyltransferase subunit 1 [Methyloligella halotolerans]